MDMAEKKKTDTKKRGLVGSVIKAARPSSRSRSDSGKEEAKEAKGKKAAQKKEEPRKELAEAAGAKQTALREESRKTAKKTPAAEPETGLHVLYTESGAYQTEFNTMFMQRKPWKPENPKHILSFMPGTVEEIKTKVGEKVEEGDVLMIFRAMKMNNNMLAPVSGKVKAINVTEGENVHKNTVMIELD